MVYAKFTAVTFFVLFCVAPAEAGAPYLRTLSKGYPAQADDVESLLMDGEAIPASAAIFPEMAMLHQAALEPMAPRTVDTSSWDLKSIEIFPIGIRHEQERLKLGGDLFLLSDKGMENTLRFLRKHDPSVVDAIGVIFDTSTIQEHFTGQVKVTVLLDNVRHAGYVFHAIPGPDLTLGLYKDVVKTSNRVNVENIKRRVILIVPLAGPEKIPDDLVLDPGIALGEKGFHHAKGSVGLRLEGGVPSVDNARMIGTSIVDTGEGYLIHYNGYWQNGSVPPVHLGVIACSYTFLCERVFVRGHMPERLGTNAFILPGPVKSGNAVSDSFAVLSAYAIKQTFGFLVFYSGDNKPWIHYVGSVTSADGVRVETRSFPVFSPTGAFEGDAGIHVPMVLPGTDGQTHRMYYNAMGKPANDYDGTMKIAVAESEDMSHWRRVENASKGKYPSNIIFAFSISEPYINAAHPMVVKRAFGGGGYTMFFVGVRRNTLGKPSGESALMRAESEDGFIWGPPTPVMVPGPVGTLDDGQIFCPRMVDTKTGMLLMMYTAGSFFEGKLRIAFASSTDNGLTWRRAGALRSLRNGMIQYISR